MKSIDEQIRQALAEEDQKLIDEIDDEAGLLEMLSMSFHGKQAWMTWYMWIMGFAAFGVGLYCLSRFFGEGDLKTSLGWALGLIACMFVLTMIKIISWSHMQKLELMREIKRLEMRVMLANERHKEGL